MRFVPFAILAVLTLAACAGPRPPAGPPSTGKSTPTGGAGAARPRTLEALIAALERGDLAAAEREVSIRVAMLHSREPRIREQACQKVAAIGPEARHMAPYLVAVLFRDDEEYVRCDAAQALFDLKCDDLAAILARAARGATLPRENEQQEIRAMCAALLAQHLGTLEDDLWPLVEWAVLEDNCNYLQAHQAAVLGLAALDDRDGRLALLVKALDRRDSKIVPEHMVRAMARIMAIDLPSFIGRKETDYVIGVARERLRQGQVR